MLASREVESRMRTLESELAAAHARIRHLESLIEAGDRASNPLHDGSAAVVFIDLDHFKCINDQFGHLAGDAALQAVSEIIVRSCRNSDVVARFGGDEFAILLWNLTEQDARAKARSFERSIGSLRIRLAAGSVSVGASAGVAMLCASESPSQTLTRADADMYFRKMTKKSAPGYEFAALPAAS